MRKTKNNYVPAEYGGYLFPKSCLPDILPGDGGKVLTVNQNETEAIWAQAQGGMVVYVNNPVYDNNRILISGTLDRTWNQINNALRNGIPVQIVTFYNEIPGASFLLMLHISWVYSTPVGCVVDSFDDNSNRYTFNTDVASGYPQLTSEPG